MNQESEFPELMARLKAGDQDAAAEIFQRFSMQLIGLARKRITGAIGAKEDPEDVVQSVFRTFFRRQADGLLDPRDWNSLWGLFTCITLRKCGRRVEHYLAGRRSVAKEWRPPVDGESVASWEAIARDPRPEEAVLLSETVESLLAQFDERERKTLRLALEGESVAEIAKTIGRSRRTVERFLDRVRTYLEQIRDGNDSDAPK